MVSKKESRHQIMVKNKGSCVALARRVFIGVVFNKKGAKGWYLIKSFSNFSSQAVLTGGQ